MAKPSSDALNRMIVDIEGGRSFDDSPVPHDDDHRQAWNRLVDELAALHDAGVEVDVPHENPV